MRDADGRATRESSRPQTLEKAYRLLGRDDDILLVGAVRRQREVGVLVVVALGIFGFERSFEAIDERFELFGSLGFSDV